MQNAATRMGFPQHNADPRELDDLMLGLNEWHSIQDVVRITFKAFHDVLRQQGESIKGIERSLDTKAGRAEVSVSLQQKANGSEVAARLAELEMMVHKKADASDMDRRALKTEVDVSLRTQMADVFAIIQTKSEAAETRVMRENCERQLSSLAVDLSRLQSGLEDMRAGMHTKANIAEVGQALSVKADMTEVEDKLRDKPSRRQVSDALALKANGANVDLDLRQLRQEVSDLSVGVSKRAEAGRLDEVDHKVERLRQRVDADSDTNSAALRTISSAFDEATVRSAAAAEHSQSRIMGALQDGLQECEEGVAQRLQESEDFIRNIVARKSDVEEVQRWLDAKADLEAVAEELEARAKRETVEAMELKLLSLPKLASRLDNIQRDVANKMVADRAIYSVLEGKANTEDVNTALLDMCKELEQRAAHEHLDLLVRNQAALQSAFQQSNTMARWLWKSGQTRPGGAVPWNVQAANTAPNIFLWEADKTVVMAMAPGLYRIEAGFYSRQRPIVQVLVDGEPCLTLVNNSSAAVHHGQAGRSQAGQSQSPIGLGYDREEGPQPVSHPAGNITGTTCTEFLSLPAASKLAVTFRVGGGDQGSEGFLALFKI